MRDKILTSLLILNCVFAAISCSQVSENEFSDVKNSVRPLILTVTGEDCPIFESELFSFNGRTDFGECEVRKNAELFNGKTIRITAVYGFMIHGSYLFSENCELPRSIDESISVGMDEKDWKYLQDLKNLSADMTAVGVFSVSKPSNQSDTIYDRTPYHFSISCLEKVTAKPRN